MQVKNGIETVNLLNCDSKTKGIDKDGFFEIGIYFYHHFC